MKYRLSLWRAALCLLALYTATLARAQRPKTLIDLGGFPAIALNAHTIYSSAHVTSPYLTARVTLNGDCYAPPGSPQWVRTMTGIATYIDEQVCNFNFAARWTNVDNLLSTTWRALPPECVTTNFWVPAKGATVLVESRMAHSVVRATVLDVSDNYILTTFHCVSGDSGSLVYGLADDFAGVVTAPIVEGPGAGGSIIYCPPNVYDPAFRRTVAVAGVDSTPVVAAPPPPVLIPAPTLPVVTPPPTLPVVTPPPTPPTPPPAVTLVPRIPAQVLAVGTDLYALAGDSTLWRLSGNAWIAIPNLPPNAVTK